MPAIVRRVRDAPGIDFEVICGARRHWAVSWLRQHNYADFRFVVEVRELTDEEAFRISDLENRAREDLSDVERARDLLLRALQRHYGGRQKDMAGRLNVSEAWLSRYLDLARLPAGLVAAFHDPHELKIKHVTLLKPLLKPEDRGCRVLREAGAISDRKGEGGPALKPQDVIRQLTLAADPPRSAGAPKRTGSAGNVVTTSAGSPVLRIDARKRKEVTLTLLLAGGASRDEAETALRTVLDTHWPQTGRSMELG